MNRSGFRLRKRRDGVHQGGPLRKSRHPEIPYLHPRRLRSQEATAILGLSGNWRRGR